MGHQDVRNKPVLSQANSLKLTEIQKSQGQTVSADYTKTIHRLLLPLLSQLHHWNIRAPSPCTYGWAHVPVLAGDLYGDATG